MAPMNPDDTKITDYRELRISNAYRYTNRDGTSVKLLCPGGPPSDKANENGEGMRWLHLCRERTSWSEFEKFVASVSGLGGENFERSVMEDLRTRFVDSSGKDMAVAPETTNLYRAMDSFGDDEPGRDVVFMSKTYFKAAMPSGTTNNSGANGRLSPGLVQTFYPLEDTGHRDRNQCFSQFGLQSKTILLVPRLWMLFSEDVLLTYGPCSTHDLQASTLVDTVMHDNREHPPVDTVMRDSRGLPSVARVVYRGHMVKHIPIEPLPSFFELQQLVLEYLELSQGTQIEIYDIDNIQIKSDSWLDIARKQTKPILEVVVRLSKQLQWVDPSQRDSEDRRSGRPTTDTSYVGSRSSRMHRPSKTTYGNSFDRSRSFASHAPPLIDMASPKSVTSRIDLEPPAKASDVIYQLPEWLSRAVERQDLALRAGKRQGHDPEAWQQALIKLSTTESISDSEADAPSAIRDFLKHRAGRLDLTSDYRPGRLLVEGTEWPDYLDAPAIQNRVSIDLSDLRTDASASSSKPKTTDVSGKALTVAGEPIDMIGTGRLLEWRSNEETGAYAQSPLEPTGEINSDQDALFLPVKSLDSDSLDDSDGGVQIPTAEVSAQSDIDPIVESPVRISLDSMEVQDDGDVEDETIAAVQDGAAASPGSFDSTYGFGLGQPIREDSDSSESSVNEQNSVKSIKESESPSRSEPAEPAIDGPPDLRATVTEVTDEDILEQRQVFESEDESPNVVGKERYEDELPEDWVHFIMSSDSDQAQDKEPMRRSPPAIAEPRAINPAVGRVNFADHPLVLDFPPRDPSWDPPPPPSARPPAPPHYPLWSPPDSNPLWGPPPHPDPSWGSSYLDPYWVAPPPDPFLDPHPLNPIWAPSPPGLCAPLPHLSWSSDHLPDWVPPPDWITLPLPVWDPTHPSITAPPRPTGLMYHQSPDWFPSHYANTFPSPHAHLFPAPAPVPVPPPSLVYDQDPLSSKLNPDEQSRRPPEPRNRSTSSKSSDRTSNGETAHASDATTGHTLDSRNRSSSSSSDDRASSGNSAQATAGHKSSYRGMSSDTSDTSDRAPQPPQQATAGHTSSYRVMSLGTGDTSDFPPAAPAAPPLKPESRSQVHFDSGFHSSRPRYDSSFRSARSATRSPPSASRYPLYGAPSRDWSPAPLERPRWDRKSSPRLRATGQETLSKNPLRSNTQSAYVPHQNSERRWTRVRDDRGDHSAHTGNSRANEPTHDTVPPFFAWLAISPSNTSRLSESEAFDLLLLDIDHRLREQRASATRRLYRSAREVDVADLQATHPRLMEKASDDQGAVAFADECRRQETCLDSPATRQNFDPGILLKLLHNSVTITVDRFLPATHPGRSLRKVWGCIATVITSLYRTDSEWLENDRDLSGYVIRSPTQCQAIAARLSIKSPDWLLVCKCDKTIYRTKAAAVDHLRGVHYPSSKKAPSDEDLQQLTSSLNEYLSSSRRAYLLHEFQSLKHFVDEFRSIVEEVALGVSGVNTRQYAGLLLSQSTVSAFESLVLAIVAFARLPAVVDRYFLDPGKRWPNAFLTLNKDLESHRSIVHKMFEDATAAMSLAKQETITTCVTRSDQANLVTLTPVQLPFIVAVILRNLQAQVFSHDVDVSSLYSLCADRLRYQVNQYPRKRLLQDIHHFEEEIDAVIDILSASMTQIRNFASVTGLDPIFPESATFGHGGKEDGRYIQHVALSLDRQRTKLEQLRTRSGGLASQVKRSVEILEEDHGKAIWVFTTVTTIFLPLSFVSSYLGMNTIDVRDTNATQGLFWAVAVPSTALIIGMALFLAYRGDILVRKYDDALLWLRRTNAPPPAIVPKKWEASPAWKRLRKRKVKRTNTFDTLDEAIRSS